MHRILIVCSLIGLSGVSLSNELQLVAVKDGTLYESPTGALANGAGTFLYEAVKKSIVIDDCLARSSLFSGNRATFGSGCTPFTEVV